MKRASRSSWRRPAQAVRRVLGSIVGRRTFAGRSDGLDQLAPTFEDAPKLIRERVDALAAAGALDEGTGAVLDPTIASWVEQWSAQVEQQHREDQSRLKYDVIEVRAERDRIQVQLDLLREELNAVNRCIAGLAQQPDQGSEERRQT
ncbi:MAG: hypothetical protein ACRDSZ_11570 [Pseudonocardiaceae bacterium]